MEFCNIIGVVLIIAFAVAAIYAIQSCSTVFGTVCCTAASIAAGALLVTYIQAVIMICVAILVLGAFAVSSD